MISVMIHRSAKKAYEVVSDVASKCIQEARKLGDTQEKNDLLKISHKLLFPSEIKIDLTTAPRTLLCECNATEGQALLETTKMPKKKK